MPADISRPEDFDWVKLRQDMGEIMKVETASEKFMRKVKENPFVPIGCACTVGALTYGVYNFLKGNSVMSQYMMRTRIVAQGATVVAILVTLSSQFPKQDQS